jgi:four helix bundle protein
MGTIAEEQIKKTYQELASPKKPTSRSRVWQSAQGYKFLFPWSNAALLRVLVRKASDDLPPRSEHRLKAQIDDAARSMAANIEEGFKRATTSEYLKFLGFSQGSLEEVRGDIERMFQDGFLKSVPGSSLAKLGLNLKAWNLWARNPLNSSKILYFPLKSPKGSYRSLEEVKGKDLSYEILKELANKTDWLLRKLVVSLEKKLTGDQKAYQVEQARIASKLT